MEHYRRPGGSNRNKPALRKLHFIMCAGFTGAAWRAGRDGQFWVSFAHCAYAMAQYSEPPPKHLYFNSCKNLDLIR